MSDRYAEPFESVTCQESRRDDGNHSWRFDGDDPYMLCVFCDERRDVLTGRALPTESALQRTTPESVSERAVLRPPTPEGGAGGR